MAVVVLGPLKVVLQAIPLYVVLDRGDTPLSRCHLCVRFRSRLGWNENACTTRVCMYMYPYLEFKPWNLPTLPLSLTRFPASGRGAAGLKAYGMMIRNHQDGLDLADSAFHWKCAALWRTF